MFYSAIFLALAEMGEIYNYPSTGSDIETMLHFNYLQGNVPSLSHSVDSSHGWCTHE